MSNLIKVAIHRISGEPVHIQNARNGLKCNCRCEKCGIRFQAIQGPENEWHFRHTNSDIHCDGAPETMKHLLAKQILFQFKKIALKDKGIIEFINPILEKSYGKIRPDVTANLNEKNLFLEVIVTHPLSKENRDFYVAEKHKSIIIFLKNVDLVDYEQFKHEVLFNTENKEIVYWEAIVETQTVKNLPVQIPEPQIVFSLKPQKTIIDYILKYWYIVFPVLIYFFYRMTRRRPIHKNQYHFKQRKRH